MSTLPLYSPKFRALDANGNPLSGGKLYAYAAGTTTPLDTFTTRAGNVANANPVVLNANGEADVWTTQGVLYKFVLKDASDVTQWTVDNVPSGSGETASTDLSSAVDPGGRLSLASANPIKDSDVTGATTLYYVPYKHSKVPLYDGTGWSLHTVSTQLSQATSDATKSPAAVANSSMYDLFIWDDAGTLRLSRGPAWSSDTARGAGAGTTELIHVDARYVNRYSISNGPAAQFGLYVGTIRSDGAAQLNDSMLRRTVWNNYNRVSRPMVVTEAAAGWTYSTNSYRQANANAANQVSYVVGLSEDEVSAEVHGCYSSDTDANRGAGVGIGVDSTSADSSNVWAFSQASSTLLISGNPSRWFSRASYRGYPGIGRHFLAWLECGYGSGIQSWYGTDTATIFVKVVSGLLARVNA